MPVQPDIPVVPVVEQLTKLGIEATFIIPSSTGLNKSIMDAIAPVRSYLQRLGIHDYASQGQGPENKRTVKAYFVEEDKLRESVASLYRPKTKNGDPRIWFSGLASYASEGNLLAITVVDGEIWVINTSKSAIVSSAVNPNTPLGQLTVRLRSISPTATELLGKLKDIASQGYVKSVTSGSTGVGATLENLLEIAINSKKTPDYKGIEIKAKRFATVGQSTRFSLFAQVPNWKISVCKSSADILDKYGYHRDGQLKLYCTVSSLSPNSQGLILSVDDKMDLLHEQYNFGNILNEVVVWDLETLRSRLLEKHRETFWVTAKSLIQGSHEFFQYESVLHTQSPNVSYLGTLLDQGVITVDHLIKRTGTKTNEKGPLFKISPTSLLKLFPPPRRYELL